jgi:CDGSH-type Zn-finger protein
MAEIRVRANGPYVASGLPVQRRRAVTSEAGEPIGWETTAALDAPENVFLCRCGGSQNKPFCDSSHASNGFVADDVAAGTYDARSKELGGTGVTIRDDRSICEHAGFCSNNATNVWKQVKATDDDAVRASVIAMIERCPSGALTYDGEPTLPMEISAVADGPLWVTGGVSVTLPDGSALEPRNRMTLCRCGRSSNKPLCDGSHKEAGFRDS